jgi:flagellar basal-body rod protein FlgB
MFSASSIFGRQFDVLAAGLDGLALRQRVHAENLANVDTPGYQAQTVDFETALRAAATEAEGPKNPMGADGATLPNGLADGLVGAQSTGIGQFTRKSVGAVNKDNETNAMLADNIRFRVLTQQVQNRISELRGVISEMGRS